MIEIIIQAIKDRQSNHEEKYDKELGITESSQYRIDMLKARIHECEVIIQLIIDKTKQP